MNDDVVLWDETTRPTLGEPEVTAYAVHELGAADHLVQIHDHLRAELDRLQGMVGEVRRGLLSVGDARAGVAAMTLRQNNWTLGAYCQSYCGFVNGHHSLEDASVFPHLRAREPDVAPVVNRLHEEHQVIHHLLDELDRALVALVRSGESTELDTLDA